MKNKIFFVLIFMAAYSYAAAEFENVPRVENIAGTEDSDSVFDIFNVFSGRKPEGQTEIELTRMQSHRPAVVSEIKRDEEIKQVEQKRAQEESVGASAAAVAEEVPAAEVKIEAARLPRRLGAERFEFLKAKPFVSPKLTELENIPGQRRATEVEATSDWEKSRAERERAMQQAREGKAE